MNTLTITGKRAQWIAGIVAVLASLLTVGGPLMLAEHYASTGASADASGYDYAAERSRLCAGPDLRNRDAVSVRSGAKSS